MKVKYTVTLVFVYLNFVNSLMCDRSNKDALISFCNIIEDTNTSDKNEVTNADSNNTIILKLSGLDFSTIPKNIFVAFPLVKIFDICYNNLIQISSNDFRGGSNLKSILILETKIKNLPRKVFTYVPNLKELWISSESITVIEDSALDGLRNLVSLRIENSPLKNIPKNLLYDLISLIDLVINNCTLKTLPNDFFIKNLNLNFIKLNNNQLQSISADLFHNLSTLVELHLDFNQLFILPDIRTSYIHAQNNQLQEIYISNAMNAIDISNNFVRKITCGKSLNATQLYFMNNSITNMDCIRDIKTLIYVELNNNKLVNLTADDFKMWKNVNLLRMNHNNDLEISNYSLKPLKELRELSVDQLSSGYKNLAETNPHLKTLYLTTTFWNCSYWKQVADDLHEQNIQIGRMYQNEDNFTCHMIEKSLK